MQWMQLSTVRPMWVLRLVPGVRFGRLLAAAGILLLLLGAYATAGMFTGHSPRSAPPTVAVFFAVILAYIVPTFHYIVARCTDAFTELTPHVDASVHEIETWRRAITQRDLGSQLAIVAIGIAAGLAHNYALSQPAATAGDSLTGRLYVAVVGGTMLVWIVMTAVISGLFRIAGIFARLAKRVRIDLLQPRSMTPFARVAVILTLVMIGAQAAFPLLWLDESTSAVASIPGLIATGVTMLFLFAMPLLPIHRQIAAAKTAEITRLDALVAVAPRGVQDGTGSLAQLAPLLAYRREIEAAREWPFDTGVSGRLAFYLVIPPITWVGAALIQHFVEGAL